MFDKETQLSNVEDKEVEDEMTGLDSDPLNAPTPQQERRITRSKTGSLPPPIVPFAASAQAMPHDEHEVRSSRLSLHADHDS